MCGYAGHWEVYMWLVPASLSQGRNHGNVGFFSLFQHKWYQLYLHMHKQNLVLPKNKVLGVTDRVQEECRNTALFMLMIMIISLI